MTDRRDEIPKEFPIREQALVVHQAARMKEDFIAKQRSKGKMSDEDMNLQAYSVAVLDAAARTLKALHAERKAGTVQPQPEQIQQVAPVVEELPPAPAESSPLDEEHWKARIAEVAVELEHMGKDAGESALHTFIPAEAHHLIADVIAARADAPMVRSLDDDGF